MRRKHDLAFACVSVQSNNRLKSLRCQIPARAKVGKGWTVYIEMLCDLLLIGATDVATNTCAKVAHIPADWL